GRHCSNMVDRAALGLYAQGGKPDAVILAAAKVGVIAGILLTFFPIISPLHTMLLRLVCHRRDDAASRWTKFSPDHSSRPSAALIVGHCSCSNARRISHRTYGFFGSLGFGSIWNWSI